MLFDEFMCYMEDEPTTWTLYFDGSKCSYVVGEGIVLVSPTNEVIHMAIKLDLSAPITWKSMKL